MKNTLFILTEDLNNGVIQSQVFGHIDFMRKKRFQIFQSYIVIGVRLNLGHH